jgi:C-methyltransferase
MTESAVSSTELPPLSDLLDAPESLDAPGPPDVPPAALLHRLMSGIPVARMIHSITELGIADLLVEGTPVAVTDLATAAGADPDTLNRVLRTLAAFGVVAAAGDQRYLPTDLSRLLRQDRPDSMRGAVLMACAEWQWQAWRGLTDSIRTGKSGFTKVFGKDVWTYFAEDDPGAGMVFQHAMADLAAMTDRPLAASIDLTGVRTVVDVGGGHGHLLRALVERNPHLEAVLFESDAVLSSLTEDPRADGLSSRLAVRSGDFRSAVDCVADVYLLKQVLHLCDDDLCVRILRNCAAYAKPGARIFVIERLVTAGPDSLEAKLFDIMMLMVQQQGRERTEDEFARLFERAGLRFRRVIPTPVGMALIEGVV